MLCSQICSWQHDEKECRTPLGPKWLQVMTPAGPGPLIPRQKTGKWTKYSTSGTGEGKLTPDQLINFFFSCPVLIPTSITFLPHIRIMSPTFCGSLLISASDRRERQEVKKKSRLRLFYPHLFAPGVAVGGSNKRRGVT